MESLDGKTIGIGIGGGVVGALLVGALQYTLADNQVDLLEKHFVSRLERIDTKLRSLDTKTGTVDVVAGKLTQLEKTLSSKVSEFKTASSGQISGVESQIKDVETKIARLTASQRGAGAKLEKSLSSRIDQLKIASSSQVSGVASRIKNLEGKIADLKSSQQALEKNIAVMKASVEKAQAKAQVAKNASSSSTISATNAGGDVDGVRLAIAQSSWLVRNKLNVALSYIYPGEDKVRIGLGDKMIDLTKGAPEEFIFEGARCNVLFGGITGDKAKISHTCPS
ncbi:MAG: hypothetical protein ACR2PF_19925 [Rhizobiaceae bacterium]